VTSRTFSRSHGQPSIKEASHAISLPVDAHSRGRGSSDTVLPPPIRQSELAVVRRVEARGLREPSSRGRRAKSLVRWALHTCMVPGLLHRLSTCDLDGDGGGRPDSRITAYVSVFLVFPCFFSSHPVLFLHIRSGRRVCQCCKADRRISSQLTTRWLENVLEVMNIQTDTPSFRKARPISPILQREAC
jgi:G:T-mismatch repair DNA endonuclease (very short patch repair protein)